MSTKHISIVVGSIVLVAAIWGNVSLSEPHGKIVARSQKKDGDGFTHRVTVRQFSGRFSTELSEEGRPSRDLPVSSYEFYEGSNPITAATITWPELHKFTVRFSNGIVVVCSWSQSNVVWTIH